MIGIIELLLGMCRVTSHLLAVEREQRRSRGGRHQVAVGRECLNAVVQFQYRAWQTKDEMGIGDVAWNVLMPAARAHAHAAVNRQRGTAHFKFGTTRCPLSAAARSTPEPPRRAQKPVPAAAECLEQEQKRNQQRWPRPHSQRIYPSSYPRFGTWNSLSNGAGEAGRAQGGCGCLPGAAAAPPPHPACSTRSALYQ